MDDWIRTAKLPSSTVARFRHVTVGDIPALKSLIKRTFPEFKYPDEWFKTFCANKKNDCCAIGCFIDETPVGLIVVSLDYLQHVDKDVSKCEKMLAAKAKRVSCLQSLGVDPNYHRLGIGADLMRLASDYCLNHPIKPNLMYLCVDRSNYGAQELYKKFGFENLDRKKRNHQPYLFAKWLTEKPKKIRNQKTLEDEHEDVEKLSWL
ncbi:hypothetical protein L596_009465 [Steinernema carpocapsae]|uniref:N-terminal methionine N(alpha)-acetyltransferase NatE n=1 Tax=Steinernema carpocapsae TaxID=34508 RepID=A0A4U5PGR5_STECR|nr:hypothetical protein L596_009465 [Steinernema carpocapsae]